MRLAVRTYDAAAIDSKHNRKFLQCHIVNDLVIGTLQERGVNGNNRFIATDGLNQRRMSRRAARQSQRQNIAAGIL
ncbi:Uncharacterised protein [Hafnia alvei]|uniref:Uncharacterized protein n=1 Tax=Hafnia alvei TaxID=569 RepID=A0A377PMZ0_HAFAL|nr:Uncharacterised protein [Hafnia alvei]